MITHAAFEYPQSPHVRRHGPQGYADYESYRAWLRDEFCFRCVFCLQREIWIVRCGKFHLEHFIPQSRDPSAALEYDNLVYACAACNAIKSDSILLPDPSSVGYGKCVQIHADGSILPLTPDGERLIDELRLDRPELTAYRERWLKTFRFLEEHGGMAELKLWLCFPDDLPNLSGLKPPHNTRPEGIDQSYFARRSRGELPETY